MKEELIIQLISIIGAIFLSIQIIIGKAGVRKLRNWFANKITSSRHRKRKISAKVHETLFWRWEQVFGIIGFICLLIALIWTIYLLVR